MLSAFSSDEPALDDIEARIGPWAWKDVTEQAAQAETAEDWKSIMCRCCIAA